MKKLSRAVAFIIALCMLLSVPITAYAAPDPTGSLAASQQLAGKGVDAAEFVTAVQQKDTNKLVDSLMKWLGDYYRQNGLKDEFGYFNADKYLATYQDVNTVYKGDRRQALEHYIVFGAKEGRISGGKYDLPLAVRKDPSFLLNTDILNAMGDPAAFLKAAEKPVEQITKSSQSTGGSSGGGSSGGGSTPTPTPTPTGPSSYTLIMYGANYDLDIPGDFLTGIMALYGTKNINMIMALGGSYKWSNGYLSKRLGLTEGSTEEKNKTGYFMVNVSELNSALDKVAKVTGIPVSSMIDIIDKDTEIGRALKEKVTAEVYSEKVLPLVEGTSVTTDAPISSQKTLDTLLELAKAKCQADTYALTFNGHGGGPRGCLPSEDGSPGLTVNTIDAALKKAGFGEQNRMSMIAFDACSMGCVETAAVLGKYCEYMYGSEALQVGGLDMNAWLSAVKNNLNSSGLSKTVAYAVYEGRAKLDMYECLNTAAISNSKYAQELLNAIEQWSEAMLAGMKDVNSDTAKKYYYALKKASAYCYQVSPTTNVYDIKDLMQEVKTFLNEQGINSLDAKITAVITAADALSEQNAVSIDGKLLYDSKKGGVIASNSKYRDEHMKYDLCGYSITFPDHLLTHLIAAPDDETEKKQYIDEIRNKMTDEYTSKYKNLGLEKYTELITAYLDRYFTMGEADRIKQLSKDMTSCNNGSGTVVGYKDIASVSWNDDKTYVQVNIKDYPEGLTQSESSSGDALIDIIDTAKDFRAYLTSKLQVVDTDETTRNVDMVFVNDTISYQSVKGYQSRIELQLNDYLADGGKNKISYVEKNDVAWQDTDYLDLLIEAQQSDASIYKEAILKAGVSEFSKLIIEREAARVAYEKEPEKEDLKNAYEAAKTACTDYSDQCTLYFGECTASSVRIPQVYLILKKNNDGNLVYCDVAKTGDEEGKYDHIDKVESIRFYHYQFSDVIDEEKDTGTDQLTAIEADSNYNGSLYDDLKYVYNVTDKDNQVTIKTVELSKFLGLSEGKGITADNLGYYMTLTNGDDQTVVLNSENNGQNVALSDEQYTTPLTQGQLKEVLGASNTVQSEEPKGEPAVEFEDMASNESEQTEQTEQTE